MAEAAVYSSTTEFLMLSYDQLRALPSAAVGVAIASGLAATGMIAVATYSVGPPLPLVLGCLGLLGRHTERLLAILVAFSLLQHLPYSPMTTAMYSMLAHIADENQLRFGERQEGIVLLNSDLLRPH